MPDINFGIGFTIFYPQGEGGAEYDPITADGVGFKTTGGDGDISYPSITADGGGFRTESATGTIEYPSLLASGGDRLHFSTGFVAESVPRVPSVCVDAMSIVEWEAEAISITEWESEAEWKVAKCKPTP